MQSEYCPIKGGEVAEEDESPARPQPAALPANVAIDKAVRLLEDNIVQWKRLHPFVASTTRRDLVGVHYPLVWNLF